MEILIIDPSDLFIERLSELILESNADITIHTATSHQEAVGLLTEVFPWIVLSDLSLLMHDDFSFCKQIVKYHAGAGIIALFIIANEFQLSQCRKQGITDLFDKYADFDKIPGAIRAFRPEKQYKGILKNK